MSAKANVFVATPCYGSWLSEDYFHSILDLQNLCREDNIALRIQTLGQESLVTRARNTLVANFLDDEDATHLLFVDADIGFKPQIVKRMLDFINKNPTYETLYGFDYHWPASLNVPFLQTRTSYLEHFARDKEEKGLHSTYTIDDPKSDFDRDRAILPTSYLQ